MKFYLITPLILSLLTFDTHSMKREREKKQEFSKNVQQHIVEIKRQKLNEADEECEQDSQFIAKNETDKCQLIYLPQELLCYIFNKLLPNLSRSALEIIAKLNSAIEFMSSSKTLREILEGELIKHIQRNFSEYKNIRDYSGNNLFALAVIEGKYQIAWMLLQVFRNDDESMYEMLYFMKRTKKLLIFDPAVFNKIFAWAISNGYKKFADILCGFIKDNGKPFNFNFPDSDRSTGKSILHFAADNSNLECVQDLLSWGSNVNARDRYGNTPLTYAIKRGHLGIAQHLARNNAKLNIHRKEAYFSNPFLCPIISGNTSVVKWLIQYGANVNCDNSDHITLVAWAKLAANGTESHDEIISILKENGEIEKAFEDFDESGKFSLLNFTIANNLIESLKIILDVINKSGENAVNEVLEFLLPKAVMRNNKEIFDLLFTYVSSKIEIEEINDVIGFSLLHAIQVANIDFAEYLIKKYNANVNFIDSFTTDMSAALQVAIEFIADQDAQIRTIEFLIQHGADVNASNSCGEGKLIPLHVAVVKENLFVVNLLLKNEADIYQMDKYGRTVFDLDCKDQRINYLLNKAKDGYKK